MKIKVFIHLNDLPGAFDVMSEQLTRMSESGLLDEANRVFLCTNGNDANFLPAQAAMMEFDNVKFVHTSNLTNHYEYPTLDMVKRNCDAADENFAVCYLHLKGLTRPNDQRVVDWRHFMEYWTVDRWEDCYNKIKEGYDLVGTNIIEQPWLHSSGNFWWSHADYIKTLEKLPQPDKIQWGTPSKWINAVLDPGNFRYEHEAWAGTGNPKWFEIAATPGKTTPGWHFENLYPESNYAQSS